MLKSKVCSVEGCGSKKVARNLCSKHYQRAVAEGSLSRHGREDFNDPEEAFEARTIPEPNSGCLLWLGAQHEAGYGRMWVGGKVIPSHRYAWERVNGEIPPNRHIDHMCHVPQCVNVDHLRLASIAENTRNRSGLDKNNTSGFRGVSWDSSRSKWTAKVQFQGKTYNLGRFDSKEEAAEIATKKRKELFGEFSGKG